MLRGLAALLACVLLLALVPTGSVYVTTLPSGADVWVDGTYVGRSPLVVDALATGRHTVNLSMAGWQGQQLEVSVVAAQTALSSSRLERLAAGKTRSAPGSIALHGLVPGLTQLDGMPVRPAKDGTIPAATGTHQLAVRTPRGRISRTVTVWPQTRTDVVLNEDVERTKPTVVAPAEDFLPKSAVRIDGERVVLKFGNHEVVGRLGSTSYRVDGRAAEYDAAPTLIGPRLYLPLELLTMLAGNNDR
jgi:hypothetical protein